jgi:anti-anti-sigma factor
MAETGQGPVMVHMVATEAQESVRLVDVEGELEAGAAPRWSDLFHGAIDDGATGIAVDLRACRTVDPVCLSVLLATSAALRARGGGGVKLVTNPDSPLGKRLEVLAAKGLPAYPSASEALLSLSDAA